MRGRLSGVEIEFLLEPGRFVSPEVSLVEAFVCCAPSAAVVWWTTSGILSGAPVLQFVLTGSWPKVRRIKRRRKSIGTAGGLQFVFAQSC